jgi:hypothetical protein|tara:strand:- start:468 stop:689 length:222 start_codon:yes stop_codon:yes gene_type:complete
MTISKNKPTTRQLKTLEKAREIWSKVAKEHNWYKEPFYVQAWIHDDGTLEDCVSFKGLNQDIILPATELTEDW